MAEWQKTLDSRFTAAELKTITEFLEAATELGERHADRIRPDRPD
jgi:hypothetical protein